MRVTSVQQGSVRFDLRMLPSPGHIALMLACLFLLQLPAGPAIGEENASNPLSKGRNTDFRLQGTQGAASEKIDAFIEGAFMATDRLKIKYELHYNDVSTGQSSVSGLETTVLKGIYFPAEGALGSDWGYRVAVGLDWIVDLDHGDDIGPEADQLGPFVGMAFANRTSGLSLIPLVQHYTSYNGPNDISQTALRVIALQPFAEDYWVKADIKVPYDWNQDSWPASAEFQIGYNVNEGFALYADLLIGIGDSRPYDTGAGIGLRFRY